MGRFKGRLGPHQISALNQQQLLPAGAAAGGADAASGPAMAPLTATASVQVRSRGDAAADLPTDLVPFAHPAPAAVLALPGCRERLRLAKAAAAQRGWQLRAVAVLIAPTRTRRTRLRKSRAMPMR